MRQLASFSTPIIIANLLQTSYQFIDSLWIGNLLGAHALGAVAVSSVIIFTTLSFVIGMNNAALTILSQQVGRKDKDGLQRYLNAFVVILFTLSLILGVAGYFLATTFLEVMGTPASILPMATQYFQINFLGMFFLFGYNFISTVLRSLGNSKAPMQFVLLAVILNIILDPLFIATFDWGIQGAGAATVVSQGTAFLYGLSYVLRKKLAPFQWPTLPTRTEAATVLSLGIPSGLQMAVISAGSAAIMSVVTSFSGEVVGGYGAAQRVDSLIMLPTQALGIAVSAMAGHNIGNRDWKRVDQISRIAVAYNFVTMSAIALVAVLLAEPAIRLFVDEPQAVAFGAQYLRITAFCYPLLGINFVLNGIVRGAGAMYQVLILNIISFWALRYPLTAVFSHLLGERGIAIGVGTSFIISSACAFSYYRFGRWREKEIFKDSAPRN